MTKQEQLDLLERGAEVWNKWRERNKDVKPDLSAATILRADLQGADLRDANLQEATFIEANLQGADLRSANLEAAKLQAADLQGADLGKANLQGADLFDANLKGAKLSDADLQGADLQSAYLQQANLSNANLKGAKLHAADLQGVELKYVNLQRVYLRSAKLQGTNLYGADLQGADLVAAELRGATLITAELQGANLSDANLNEANLVAAKLQGTNLCRTSLHDADLRNVHGLRLDATFIRNARFSPRAVDPWSVLRRTYTGPRMLFNLLFLVAFAIPYAGKVAFWSSVNRMQGYSASMLFKIEQRARELGLDNGAITALGLDTETITNLSRCLSVSCEPLPTWMLVLGVDRGTAYWTLACALLLYNVLRALLTYTVAPIRDEEERSGYSPAWTGDHWWSGYQPLYHAHRVVSLLLLVAIAALMFNAWHWLIQPVWLPGVAPSSM